MGSKTKDFNHTVVNKKIDSKAADLEEKVRFSTRAKKIGVNVQANIARDINIHPTIDKIARRVSSVFGVLVLITGISTLTYLYITDWSIEPSEENYQLWLHKGDSLLLLENFEEARAAFEKAMKYSPGDSSAFKKINQLDRIETYLTLEDHERVKETIDVVLKIDGHLQTGIKLKDKKEEDELKPGQIPPITMRIKRHENGIVELIISGGEPFKDDKSPYKIGGLGKGIRIEWQKKNDAYHAFIDGLKNGQELEIFVSDKRGTRKSEMLSAITTEQLFNNQISVADNLFKGYQFVKAKNIYQKALLEKQGDKHCLNQIKRCDHEIELIKAKTIKMVFVKGGEFAMGNRLGGTDEKPEHKVLLSNYYISKHEITVKEYKNFCKATGTPMPNMPIWGWNDNHPIVNVNWQEAQDFCRWAGGRLPTESEWEFAARGGSKSNNTKYSGSNNANEVGWYNNNSKEQTTKEVGTKPIMNELGIKDMSGNVWEWCFDWYAENYYSSSIKNNPKGPVNGSERVLRGGSWQGLVSYTTNTYRNMREPNYRKPYIGFRLVRIK